MHVRCERAKSRCAGMKPVRVGMLLPREGQWANRCLHDEPFITTDAARLRAMHSRSLRRGLLGGEAAAQ